MRARRINTSKNTALADPPDMRRQLAIRPVGVGQGSKFENGSKDKLPWTAYLLHAPNLQSMSIEFRESPELQPIKALFIL